MGFGKESSLYQRLNLFLIPFDFVHLPINKKLGDSVHFEHFWSIFPRIWNHVNVFKQIKLHIWFLECIWLPESYIIDYFLSKCLLTWGLVWANLYLRNSWNLESFIMDESFVIPQIIPKDKNFHKIIDWSRNRHGAFLDCSIWRSLWYLTYLPNNQWPIIWRGNKA